MADEDRPGWCACCCCARNSFSGLVQRRGEQLELELSTIRVDLIALAAREQAAKGCRAGSRSALIAITALEVLATLWLLGTEQGASVLELAALPLWALIAAAAVAPTALWCSGAIAACASTRAVRLAKELQTGRERALTMAVAELPADRAKSLVRQHAISKEEQARLLGPLAAVSQLEDKVKRLEANEAFLLGVVDAVAGRAVALPLADAMALLGPRTRPFALLRRLVKEPRCPRVGQLIEGLSRAPVSVPAASQVTPQHPTRQRQLPTVPVSAEPKMRDHSMGGATGPRPPATAGPRPAVSRRNGQHSGFAPSTPGGAAAAPPSAPATPLSFLASMLWSPAPTPAALRAPAAVGGRQDHEPADQVPADEGDGPAGRSGSAEVGEAVTRDAADGQEGSPGEAASDSGGSDGPAEASRLTPVLPGAGEQHLAGGSTRKRAAMPDLPDAIAELDESE